MNALRYFALCWSLILIKKLVHYVHITEDNNFTLRCVNGMEREKVFVDIVQNKNSDER